MDSNSTSRAAAALERLFRAYPSSARADEDVRQRVDRAQLYLEAVQPYDVRDIEAAAQSFITGSAPGVNPSYLPAAPAVAAEVRRLMNLRLDSEHRMRRPSLPPPEVERTDDERARAKAMIEEAVANLAGVDAADTVALEKRMAELWGRTNARFSPDMSESAMMHRLGYSVGDEDGDRDVA